jgi:hypothetical protein
MTKPNFADIPAPTDAIDPPGDWEDLGAGYVRMFTASIRALDDLRVQIVGIQSSDGTVERSILTTGDGLEEMLAPQARRLAAVLIEAADKLEPRQVFPALRDSLGFLGLAD